MTTASHAHFDCLFACPLNGTPLCLQTLLPVQCVEDERVTVGVAAGLRAVLPDGVMPPCLHDDLQLDFIRMEADAEACAV